MNIHSKRKHKAIDSARGGPYIFSPHFLSLSFSRTLSSSHLVSPIFPWRYSFKNITDLYFKHLFVAGLQIQHSKHSTLDFESGEEGSNEILQFSIRCGSDLSFLADSLENILGVCSNMGEVFPLESATNFILSEATSVRS